MKGKKLPGHMGVDRITLQERPIMQVDEANRLLYIKGSIPGHRNSVVELRF
jgi:large subunit ribosomal protein L3